MNKKDAFKSSIKLDLPFLVAVYLLILIFLENEFLLFFLYVEFLLFFSGYGACVKEFSRIMFAN